MAHTSKSLFSLECAYRGWIRKVMYKTIVLDCQTTTSEVKCEDCIVYKQCKNRKTTADNTRFVIAS